MPDLDEEEQSIAIASLCNDSRFARDERRAGVVVERLQCPLLLATGSEDSQWPARRYEKLWLPARISFLAPPTGPRPQQKSPRRAGTRRY